MWRGALFALVLAVLASACQSSSFPQELQEQVGYSDLEAARTLIDRTSADGYDQGLIALESGILERLDGNSEASNKALESIKRRIVQMQAVSVSGETIKTLVTGSAGEYEPSAFEDLMVRYYKVINFMEMGEQNNARIEARQIDTLLRKYDNLDGATRAFFRGLTALVYASLQEWQDTAVAIRSAQKQENAGLPASIARLIECNKQIDNKPCPLIPNNKAKLFLLVENGLVDLMQEKVINIPNPISKSYIKIALPEYPHTLPLINDISFLNLQAVVRADLNDKTPKIIAQATSRAVAKTVTASVVSKSGDKEDETSSFIASIAGFLIQTVGSLVEKADLRSWALLPSQILLLEMDLPPNASASSEEDPRSKFATCLGGEKLSKQKFASASVNLAAVRCF